MFINSMSTFIDKTTKEYFNFQKARNTWPYRINKYDQIPDLYKNVFPSFEEGSFPYTIIIPDENYSFFKKKGYMIVVIEDKLHIFDKLGSKINSIYFDKQDILYLVSGAVLLYSWITIAGKNRLYTFNFNSVMDYLFLPIIEKFRDISQISDYSSENEKICLSYESKDVQLKSNLKFRNLLRNQFIKGRKIKNIIFQSSYLFSNKQLPLFNLKLFKRYIFNHLILLTEEELIFIQERKKLQKKLKICYDYSYTFVHKKNIALLEEEYEQENNYKGLIFTLKNGTKLSAFFSLKNKYLDSFISKLKRNLRNIIMKS